MRAIIAHPDGPQVADIDQPSAGPGQVLVKVHAAALNRIDLLMSRGGAHGSAGGAGLPFGVEWAGEIAALGPGASGWNVGDRVMGAGPMAFADYTLAYGVAIYPVPESISYEQAACLPVGLQTMHDAIATNGRLEAGQTVLIQGASSGMGLMGIQVAKILGASKVIGTSTSDARRDRLADFGADLSINSRASDWVDLVLAATDGSGVDLVADLVAGPLINGSMKATRIGGRLVNIGRVGGEQGEFDFDLHSMRQITYVGVTFRTRSPAEVVAVVDRARRALMPAVANGGISMPIAGVYPVAEASSACAIMAENKHFGKLILSFD